MEPVCYGQDHNPGRKQRLIVFFSSLSTGEKGLLGTLPCVNKPECGGAEELKAKFLKSFPREVADRAFILTGSGVEVFTGQQLSPTYSSLITEAKNSGENIYIEKSESNSTDRTKVIVVKKISDISSAPTITDKYLFLLLENKKPGVFSYLPFAAGVTFPVILIFFCIL